MKPVSNIALAQFTMKVLLLCPLSHYKFLGLACVASEVCQTSALTEPHCRSSVKTLIQGAELVWAVIL